MKRYAFPLTIILLLFAVIALAAPGDKRPAVTSAAIGLGSSSSPTLASVTATTSVTAPAFNSTAADGYHYVLPYNSVAFAGTPSVGMMQTTPTGPQWYTGSAWEAIGNGGGSTWGSITGTLSAQTDLQTALNAKASTSYVDTAIAGVTAGNIPFVSDTTPPSAENTINYSRSDHKFRFRYPNGDVYASAAMTLETAADTTPAAFAFTDLTDVSLSTTQTATPVQITGINYPAAVTATGGTAAICTGATVGTCGTFLASPGNVALNQYVSAQHTSSGSNSTAVDTVVTVGTESDTFTSTTVAGESYLINELFTPASVPSGWANSAATFPGGYMEAIGAQSARSVAYTASSVVYATAKITLKTGSAMPTNYPKLIAIKDSSDASLAWLSVVSNGKIDANIVGATHAASVTSALMSAGTALYCKLKYDSVAHIATVWSSSTGASGSWENETSTAAGTASNDAVYVMLAANSADSTSTWQWDDLRVSTADINY